MQIILSECKDRYDWSQLNRLQLGKYAEYFAKKEFIRFGSDVFTSEVDSHGIDFVIRTPEGQHYDVQVKSFRVQPGKTAYIFLPKDKFRIAPSSLLTLVKFNQGQFPTLFLLQSGKAEDSPHSLFENRPYGNGKKSAPEWGLTLSKRKLAELTGTCSFDRMVRELFK